MRISIPAVALLLIVIVPPARAAAQAPPPAPAGGAALAPPKPPPKLVFEREVFDYPVSSRRDPFKPLSSNDTAGPVFTDLTLTGILYYSDASKSMATFHDTSKKEYRLHRGDSVGNATIQYIDKTRVVFSIEEFGMKRQEVLELKLARSGE